jgi:hypothetical protein
MTNETPRTDSATCGKGYGIPGNTVTADFARQLERELNDMRKALDELHVVVECATGDIIHDWYCTDPLASQARETVLQILNRRRDA